MHNRHLEDAYILANPKNCSSFFFTSYKKIPNVFCLTFWGHIKERKDGLNGDFLKPIEGGWRKFVIDANAGKEATSHAEVMQLAPGYRNRTVQIDKVPVSSSVLDHKTPKFGYDIYDNEQ